ncbi:CPBP family intramembrane metalloprotease [Hymenobacter sediminis]|nr:CPBP family intramembrane metalloprotease [Hymenobacter sediminis]
MNNDTTFLSSVHHFLTHPQYYRIHKHSIYYNIKFLLYSFLLCALGIILSGGFILLIDKLFVYYTNNESIYQQIKSTTPPLRNTFGVYTFVVIVFIGPFFEEVLFRLPLDIRRTHISIFFFILIFHLFGNSILQIKLTEISYIFGLIFGLASFLFIQLFTNELTLNKIKNDYYSYCIYASILSFSLLHITNFKNIQYKYFPFYILLTLPQFIMGIFITHIRLKRGFIWGFILHALINTISFL